MCLPIPAPRSFPRSPRRPQNRRRPPPAALANRLQRRRFTAAEKIPGRGRQLVPSPLRTRVRHATNQGEASAAALLLPAFVPSLRSTGRRKKVVKRKVRETKQNKKKRSPGMRCVWCTGERPCSRTRTRVFPSALSATARRPINPSCGKKKSRSLVFFFFF